jgi:hypothetical protein
MLYLFQIGKCPVSRKLVCLRSARHGARTILSGKLRKGDYIIKCIVADLGFLSRIRILSILTLNVVSKLSEI